MVPHLRAILRGDFRGFRLTMKYVVNPLAHFLAKAIADDMPNDKISRRMTQYLREVADILNKPEKESS